ncbi:MAG: hypothetical protein II951_01475 [Bacteroidales bacterium]|nr:hypothetical protein [Bacteroidales bacterium]
MKYLISVLAASLFLLGCTKEVERDAQDPYFYFDNDYWLQSTDTVVTGSASDITFFSAKLRGRLNIKGNLPSVLGSNEKHGFLLSTISVDSLITYGADSVKTILNRSQQPTFTSEVTGLLMGTTYKYRAFAFDAKRKRYVYGRVFYFTTVMGRAESLDASDVTPYSATIYGNTSIDIRDKRFSGQVGVLYTDRNTDRPNVKVDKIAVGHIVPNDSTLFQTDLEGLREQTTYTYMAFLKIDTVYYFGYARKFTTAKLSISDDAMVDLGLTSHTLWASKNVGANSVTDPGDYFPWGDPSGEKYTGNVNDYAVPNESIQGVKDRDMASMNMGVGYETPTYEQFSELVRECTWHWTTYQDVPGIVVVGPSGRTLFLPAGGSVSVSSSGERNVLGQGLEGNFWTSNANDFRRIYYLHFSSSGVDSPLSTRMPYFGHNVRPVVAPQ